MESVQREYPDVPITAVGAVIIDRGTVLLIMRGRSPLLGEWSIPGGAVEIGETIREAVVREIQEETGLEIEPIRLLGVYDRIVRDAVSRIAYHYILIDYLCKVISGQAAAATDCQDARWFSPSELVSISLPENTEEVIRNGFGPFWV